jgi:hypothetical protein
MWSIRFWTGVFAAFFAFAASAGAAARIPKAFAPAILSLHVVTFPVLLPTVFTPGTDLDHHRDYLSIIQSLHHYAVFLKIGPCRDVSRNACSEGSIEGYDAAYRRSNANLVEPISPRTPGADEKPLIRNRNLILDVPVPLARGLTGFYTENHSGADEGGNSALRWNDRGIEYIIVTRISTRAQLTRIANSAIRNGPIF